MYYIGFLLTDVDTATWKAIFLVVNPSYKAPDMVESREWFDPLREQKKRCLCWMELLWS